MEDAIQTMVKVFLKTTKGKESLGKKEFQSLVSNQLSNILTDTDSKEAINNMGKGLDSDHDGKVGFEEYLKLVGYLACSLSEQRGAAKEEPAQNAAAADQGTQSAPSKEEEKPEANAEPKEEAEPKASEEAKAEATAEAKAEAQADAKVEVKAEAQAEGEAKPGVAKGDAATAEEAAVEEAGKEAVKQEETVKPEESAEKAAAAVEEEVEKKTEEKTS